MYFGSHYNCGVLCTRGFGYLVGYTLKNHVQRLTIQFNESEVVVETHMDTCTRHSIRLWMNIYNSCIIDYKTNGRGTTNLASNLRSLKWFPTNHKNGLCQTNPFGAIVIITICQKILTSVFSTLHITNAWRPLENQSKLNLGVWLCTKHACHESSSCRSWSWCKQHPQAKELKNKNPIRGRKEVFDIFYDNVIKIILRDIKFGSSKKHGNFECIQYTYNTHQ